MALVEIGRCRPIPEECQRQASRRPPWFVNPLIAGYLVIQVLYPIRGFIADRFDTWGRFTWNMYASSYKCRARYQVVDDSGATRPVDIRPYLTRGISLGANTYHRDALPVFHKFLCAELARANTGGRLSARCECTVNDGETQSLIVDTGDICRAANYGVAAQ